MVGGVTLVTCPGGRNVDIPFWVWLGLFVIFSVVVDGRANLELAIVSGIGGALFGESLARCWLVLMARQE